MSQSALEIGMDLESSVLESSSSLYILILIMPEPQAIGKGIIRFGGLLTSHYIYSIKLESHYNISNVNLVNVTLAKKPIKFLSQREIV